MWSLSFFSKLKHFSLLCLRVAVGCSFFLFHGMDKLRPGGAWDWGRAFADKVDAPAVLAYVAAYTEFLAGLALILGLLTRWASIGLICVMAYAFLVVHGDDPFKVKELALAYAAACFALLCVGPGAFSLDRAFFGKRAVGD